MLEFVYLLPSMSRMTEHVHNDSSKSKLIHCAYAIVGRLKSLITSMIGGAVGLEGQFKDERLVPKRPTLPTLLFGTIAFWLGACVGEQVVWQSFIESGFLFYIEQEVGSQVLLVCLLAFVPAVLFCASIFIRKKTSFGPIFIICFWAIGVLLGFVSWSSFVSLSEDFEDTNSPYTLTIISDATSSSIGWRSDASISSNDGQTVKARIYWDSEQEALPYGASFEAKGSFRSIENKEQSSWMFSSMVSGTFSIESEDLKPYWSASLSGVLGALRDRTLGILFSENEQFSGIKGLNATDGQALLSGIVLGYESAFEQSGSQSSWQITGLTHLIAVSGGHMATVCMLAAWMLSRTRANRRFATILLVLMMVCYLVFTGMAPSAIRSCIMAGVASFGWMVGRKNRSADALVVTIVLMIVIDPSTAFSLGFLLSVVGVGSLALFLPLASYWTEKLLPRCTSKLSDPLAMTLVAQIATTPVSASAFSMLSIIGPISNLIASPVVSFLLAIGLVGCVGSLLFEPLGMLILLLASYIADIFSVIVNWMAALPFAAIPIHMDGVIAGVVIFAIGALLWVFWPLPAKQTVRVVVGVLTCAFASLILWPSYPTGVVVTMMDVGQGDAILIRDGPRAVLVDTGQYDQELLDALARNYIFSLDGVILSHFDADHSGALQACLSMVDVKSVGVSAKQLEAMDELEREEYLSSVEVFELEEGDVIRISDRLSATVVWPAEDYVMDGSNENSLCLLVEYDDGINYSTLLLTGDAEAKQLDEMLDTTLAGILTEDGIDILKVGHHGSKESVDEDVLKELSPKIALVSVGEDNRYGHPADSTIKCLEESGVVIFRTDLDGDVTIKLGG